MENTQNTQEQAQETIAQVTGENVVMVQVPVPDELVNDVPTTQVDGVMVAEVDVTNLLNKYSSSSKRTTTKKEFSKKTQKPSKKAVRQETKLQVVVPSERQATTFIKGAFKDMPTRVLSDHDYKEADDGVTHININGQSKCALGVFLDLYSHTQFMHAELGEFDSLAAFECFVRSTKPNDSMRRLSNYQARAALKDTPMRQVDGIRVIIADAGWQKLLSYPEMCNALVSNKLPFTMYFYLDGNFGRRKVQMRDVDWYIKAIEEMQDTLIARRDNQDPSIQPNFSFLL